MTHKNTTIAVVVVFGPPCSQDVLGRAVNDKVSPKGRYFSEYRCPKAPKQTGNVVLLDDDAIGLHGSSKNLVGASFPVLSLQPAFQMFGGSNDKALWKTRKGTTNQRLGPRIVKQLVRAIVVVVVVAVVVVVVGGDSRDVLVLDTCRRTIGGKNNGIDQSGRVKWCRQTEEIPSGKRNGTLGFGNLHPHLDRIKGMSHHYRSRTGNSTGYQIMKGSHRLDTCCCCCFPFVAL